MISVDRVTPGMALRLSDWKKMSEPKPKMSNSALPVRRVYEESSRRSPKCVASCCVDSAAEKYVPEEDNIGEWVAEMDRRRVRILGSRLQGIQDVTTVRRRNGKVLVTDGPFVETKEWIAGFDLLECADLDAAIEVASKHPMARFGKIEIRQLCEE
jgi:hypothetical protein